MQWENRWAPFNYHVKKQSFQPASEVTTVLHYINSIIISSSSSSSDTVTL